MTLCPMCSTAPSFSFLLRCDCAHPIALAAAFTLGCATPSTTTGCGLLPPLLCDDLLAAASA